MAAQFAVIWRPWEEGCTAVIKLDNGTNTKMETSEVDGLDNNGAEKTEEHANSEDIKLEVEEALTFENGISLRNCKMDEGDLMEQEVRVASIIKKEVDNTDDSVIITESAFTGEESKTLSKSSTVDHGKSHVMKHCEALKSKTQNQIAHHGEVSTNCDVAMEDHSALCCQPCEEDNTATVNSDTDTTSKDCTKTETGPIKSVDNNDTKETEECLSSKDMKVDMEETMTFDNDSWLKNGHTMDEVEPSIAMVKVRLNTDDSKITDSASVGEKNKTLLKITMPRQSSPKTSVHVCKVCTEEVSRGMTFLSRHLKSKHKLSVKDYIVKYFHQIDFNANEQEMLQGSTLSQDRIGNLCTFRCAMCSKLFESYSSLKNHFIRSKCQSYKANLLNFIESVTTHKCKICSKYLFCDRVDITRHVRLTHELSLIEYSEITGYTLVGGQQEKDAFIAGQLNTAKTLKELGNFCTFKCKICSHVTTSWRDMRKHLKDNKHYSQEGKGWHHYADEKVMYQCLICDDKVLNDSELVKNHLKSKHSTTVSDYVKTYNVPRELPSPNA